MILLPYLRNHYQIQHYEYSFSSKSFIVVAFRFRTLIHFELMLTYGIGKDLTILSLGDYLVFPAPFIEKTIFSLRNKLTVTREAQGERWRGEEGEGSN